MDKKRTLQVTLAVAVAAVISIPLIAQVKKAQTNSNTQADATSAENQTPGIATAAEPATKPVEVDPQKVIVTDGVFRVTAGEFQAAVAAFPPQYAAALSDPAFKKRVAAQIIQVKEMAAEAKKQGLEDKPDVKQQIDIQTDQVLANALAREVQDSHDEKDAHAYFDAHKSSFDNVKARHILIRTPGSPVPVDAGKKELTDAEAKAKADQIEQQLAKGGDFAAIAKAESDDTGSGPKGGDLGTFAPWTMDSTFSKAALALQKNQISQPVKTQYGYHIIQLLDDQPRSFEEARGDIGKARLNQIVNSENQGAKPEYDPGFFSSAGETVASASTQPAAAHLPANH